MSRLLIFGCSHAYGFGLPDCKTVEDKPSMFAFGNVLAKMLSIPIVNCSDPGASQKQIALTILQTKLKKEDIVVINWTYPLRRGIWNGSHWEQLAGWNKDKVWQKFYQKYNNVHDDIVESLMYINLANYHLQKKVYKVINSVHKWEIEEQLSKVEVPWNKVKFDINFAGKDESQTYFKELPCGHPNLKSHSIFAERLFNIIKSDDKFI